jgi:hypothetical protein
MAGIRSETAPGLSEDRAQELLEFDAAANAQLAAFIEEEVTTDEALDDFVDFLEERSDIVDAATITTGAASVRWETTDGILMAQHAGVERFEGQRSATDGVQEEERVSSAASDTNNNDEEEDEDDDHDENESSDEDNDNGGNISNDDNNTEEPGSAIVLGPFAWQFEPSDETNEIAQDLEDAGFSVTLKRNEQQADQNVSIEDFKDLDQHEAVAIATHGDGFADGSVIVLTGDTASQADLVANQSDLLAQRLVLSNGTFAVTSSFIREYNSDFDDSVIYIGSCRSTFSDDMANAFLEEGADAFVGYTDYVGSDFADVRGQRLFTELLAGRTTGNVTGIDVDRETDSDPALFDLIGARDATLPPDGDDDDGRNDESDVHV